MNELVSMEQMADFVNEELMESIIMVCGAADKSISAVEVSLVAVLSLSIAGISSNEDEVRIQCNAYAKFLLISALSCFAEKKETSH